MKEKERYTILSFWNGEKEDRVSLLRKLGLSVKSEEFYNIAFSPKPGVQTSVNKVPVVLAEFLRAHVDVMVADALTFIKRSRPLNYDTAYDQIKSRFGFSHVVLSGGNYPNQWILVSEPEYAGEHKEKVLIFQEYLRRHNYKLNEGECLQIDICKTWKEASQ